MATADDIVTTAAERACLDALREATGQTDGPMERHCVRQLRIAERLGQDGGLEVDHEVLVCAALLHDAGLFPSVATGDVYTTDGRRLAERTLAPFAWEPARLARCLDAIEQHHALRSRSSWGAEVELMRRSDLVDVSVGLVRFGLPRSWLKQLFAEVPRHGFFPMIGREVLRAARQRPTTLPRIFRPPSAPTPLA